MESRILDLHPELFTIVICGVVSKLIIEKLFKLKMPLLSSFGHSFTIIFLGSVIGLLPILIGIPIPSEAVRRVIAPSLFLMFPTSIILCSFLVFKSALKKESDHEASKKSLFILSISFALTFFLLFFASMYIEDIFLQNSL